MKELTQTEITEIELSVRSFNNGSWNDDCQMSTESALESARDIGVAQVKENLRRADIRGYRAEEARNGDI